MVRQLTESDWEIFRHIRLESLFINPEYFAPSEDETKFTPQKWIERLANKNGATFGLFNGSTIIGVTGILRENNNSLSDRAVLMASFIKPEFRGKHLSRLLYEARIEWAKSQKNIETLVIYHRQDNIISKKANQRFGFQYINSFEKTYLNGQKSLSLVYELKI